jgi:hypothetical protein
VSVLAAEDRAVVAAWVARARGVRPGVLTERGKKNGASFARVEVAGGTGRSTQPSSPRSVSTLTLRGLCVYCGAPTLRRTTCVGHSDLPDLDPATAAVVTENTNGSGRTSPEEMSAARARQERF